MHICTIIALKNRKIKYLLFFLISLHQIIVSSPPYFKNRRISRQSLGKRDWRTQAKFPRSNEATNRVTKGKPPQLAYAGLPKEVLPYTNIVINDELHVHVNQFKFRLPMFTPFTNHFSQMMTMLYQFRKVKHTLS